MNAHWRQVAFVLLSTVAALALPMILAHADAPGAPGVPSRWAPAAKQAVGTAYEARGAASPVWFTLSESVLTEIFYPSVDQAQVGEVQFAVTDGRSFYAEQKRDTISKVRFLNSMVVTVSGRERLGRFTYEQEIVTDGAAPVVRVRTRFKSAVPGLRVILLYKPTASNSGESNLASVEPGALVATSAAAGFRGPVTSVVTSSTRFARATAGYAGFSDGRAELERNFRLGSIWREAGPGNVALAAELDRPSDAGLEFETDVAIAFGASREEALTYADTSLRIPFDRLSGDYGRGWRTYLAGLSARFMASSAFARRSAVLIKMHEDKRRRGAIVASLSKPGIPDTDHALDTNRGGYHLVWPRDACHAAMGLLAAGDHATARAVLRHLVAIQKPDGSFDQSSWVDGAPYWPGLQLDQVAQPILLAAQIAKKTGITLDRAELEMVARAAAFLITHGPATPEDRWDEPSGYSPATIAVEVAALRAATRLTGDPAGQATAHLWQAQLEGWTLARSGPHGADCYLRARPLAGEMLEIANGGGPARADEILDASFLELVRRGVRAADDPRVLATLRALEAPAAGLAARVPGVPGAMTYRRYSRDAYGVRRVGGYWPLIAGERGHYALAAGDLPRARAQLLALERGATRSGLLPEQTVTPPASRDTMGAGVACPLVRAHAEDLLLHRSIEEGIVFDGVAP